MKSKAQIFLVSLALLLVPLPQIFGQHTHDHGSDKAWRTGMLRISTPVLAGDVLLKSGMYHVKHLVEGDKHVIVFMSVTMPAGYKEYSMVEEKEVARLECRVEPVSQSTSNTKVRVGKNAAGERAIQEIQVAGEKVKHIVLSGAGATQQ